MRYLYLASTYIHILAAITWIGGTIFLASVLVPLTRQVQSPPGAGAAYLRQAARRFRNVGWASLAVLVVTGITNLEFRNIRVWSALTSEGWFSSVLQVKVGLVAVVLVLSALHDFVLGPRLVRRLEAAGGASRSAPALQRQRKAVAWLARVNLLLMLAIVVAAILLVRGLP